jgi:hypothetical protein
MLKFTYLINFGLAGALVAPSVTQKLGGIDHLEASIANTDLAIAELQQLETLLSAGDHSAVEQVLSATEEPFGGIRERSILLDQLRDEIGRLERKVEKAGTSSLLPHLQDDPTEQITTDSAAGSAAPTVGLTQENRDTLEEIWPPVPGSGKTTPVRKDGDRLAFEEEGFTVDALRQGRTYYRANRYKEALRLIETRRGDPEADYWIGRCLERLDRTKEAIAMYTSVEEAVKSGPLADRAKADREFLEWLINFDRKVRDLRGEEGAAKR